MAAATTTRRSSTSCGSILNFRANNSVDEQQHHHQSRDDDVVRSHSHNHHQSIAAVNNSGGGGGGGGSCTGKVDGVAMWIINGVATAFFASLHRCSCIRIATVDDGDDLNDEDDLPLIFNDANFNNNQRDGMSGFGRRRRKATIIFQDNKDQKNKSAAQD